MPQPPLKAPKSISTKTMGNLKGVAAFLYFFTICIVINCLQVLSLLIRPFSLKAFRRINRTLVGFWWGQCVTGAVIYGIKPVITGDELPREENAVLIANHQDMADIPFLFFIAKSIGRIGDMKWYVKDILKWTPGIGWGMWFIDCIFVKRDWHKDKANIDKTFASLTTGNVPTLVISFVEGTRIRPHKIEKAKSFAVKQGIQAFDHVLIPRAKGFSATISGMRDHIDAVYDVTIGYEKGVPTLWQYMKGYVKSAHLHVKRCTIKSLPESDENLKEWLMLRFSEKDQRLAYFYESGKMTSG